MANRSKTQRKKARKRQAAEARRQAQLRRRRNIATAIAVVAIVGIAALGWILIGRAGRERESNAELAPQPVEFTPGPGKMCPVAEVTKPPQEYPGPPPPMIDPQRRYIASMNIYTYGVVKIELLAKEAPWAVNSFVFLACEGHYTSSMFIRLVDTPTMKILQGGDGLRKDGTGNPYGTGFRDELDLAKREGYRRGTLAMANSGPDTNGSQFFFVIQDSVGIPPNYTVFGRVIEGMEYLDQAFAVGTPAANGDGQPARNLYIEWVTIEEDPPSQPVPEQTGAPQAPPA
jgi:cyclophilin family peptidyl-prolyl cis-trans isomerase